MEVFWIGLGMSVLIGAALGAIVLYSRLVEGRAPSAPKSEPAGATQEATSRPATSSPAPSLAARMAAHIMSRLEAPGGALERPGVQVAADSREGVQGFAKGRNPDNDQLSAQPLAQPAIPEDARDIIIFWERVSQVERIVAAGKIGQVEAIELIFNCKRNGRIDSVYGRARAAITARSESTYRANQDRLVELQKESA